MVDVSDLVGVPFVAGSSDPKVGLDCYGVVVEVYRRFGIALEHYRRTASEVLSPVEASRLINELGREWVRVEDAVVPCVILIRNYVGYANHLGVYVGEGRFVHALAKVGVVISKLSDRVWARRIVGFYVHRSQL